MENNNDNFIQLDERVERLEKSKGGKDIWDVIGIISSFLIPLSIFIAGYFFSKVERETQLENQKKEVELAQIKSKIDQAQLVSTFLESLVDTNSYKRQLAIKSILLALPDKGPELVQIVSVNDPDKEVQEFAKTSLRENKLRNEQLNLIRNIFSKDKANRIRSTGLIIRNWADDEALIPELLTYAKTRVDNKPENMSGIINTIVILRNMDDNALQANYQEIMNNLDLIQSLKGRNQTKAHADTLQQKMKSL